MKIIIIEKLFYRNKQKTLAIGLHIKKQSFRSPIKFIFHWEIIVRFQAFLDSLG